MGTTAKKRWLMTRTSYFSFSIFFLPLLSGCGLLMDNEERLDRAEDAFERGDFRAAIIDSKNVLRDEPDNLRGRIVLGRASVEISDGASAEKEFRRALELGASPTQVAADFARALLLQRKFQQVIDEVSLDSIEEESDLASLRRIFGYAYLGLDEPENARQNFSAALSINSNDVDSRLGIISTYVAEQNYTQARASIQQLLEDHGDEGKVWLYSGNLNATLGNARDAEASFRKALDLASDGAADDLNLQVQAMSGIAQSLLEQEKTDEARPFIEKLKSAAPRALTTLILAARLSSIDQEWGEAQGYLRDALSHKCFLVRFICRLVVLNRPKCTCHRS